MMMTTNLLETGRDLLRLAGEQPAGRAAETLPTAGAGGFRQSVLALRQGQRLADHEAPVSASLQVVTGRVRFTTADGAVALATGDLLAMPGARHGVEALEDSVLLLTVARGT